MRFYPIRGLSESAVYADLRYGFRRGWQRKARTQSVGNGSGERETEQNQGSVQGLDIRKSRSAR